MAPSLTREPLRYFGGILRLRIIPYSHKLSRKLIFANDASAYFADTNFREFFGFGYFADTNFREFLLFECRGKI